ncbi:MAG: NUDIX domain-containing protein [Planctomycetes bacterium]|nr:NUDIX domain-containing protein [Planctomycetota bacterium]
MTDQEKVLVVPRRELDRARLLPHGFSPGGIDRVKQIIQASGEFMLRESAEQQPEWKQIIPYGVVRCSGKVFLLKRSRKGGEPRLYNRWSIGVGGHINPAGKPRDLESPVEAELRRELEEELVWKVPYRLHPLGLLNDDSNAVGQVHFGLVYLVEARTPEVAVRETELLSGSFAGAAELRGRLPEMESWSQLVAAFLMEEPFLMEELGRK